MSNTKYSEWMSLKDVQQLLGIGRTKAYELVVTGELPAQDRSVYPRQPWGAR